MVDGRHSEQFSAGAQDARQRVQLGLLLRTGILGVGLGQMAVVVLERDLERESLPVNWNGRN